MHGRLLVEAEAEVKRAADDRRQQIKSGHLKQPMNHPEDVLQNHVDEKLKMVAGYWSAHIGKEITKEDVCILMGLLNAVKLKNNERLNQDMAYSIFR